VSSSLTSPEAAVRVDNQLGPDGTDRRPKYESERTTVVCPSLVARLQVRCEHTDGYVFLDDGSPLSAWRMGGMLTAAWDRLAMRAKGHSWHVLRHTFATTLRTNGIDQFVIDSMMGHKRSGVSAIYQHVLDEELNQAAAIMEQVFGLVVGQDELALEVLRVDDLDHLEEIREKKEE
jgi:integrase